MNSSLPQAFRGDLGHLQKGVQLILAYLPDTGNLGAFFFFFGLFNCYHQVPDADQLRGRQTKEKAPTIHFTSLILGKTYQLIFVSAVESTLYLVQCHIL